ncbi:MAG: hypothetical protein EPO07_13500 [Verrucomicrobia bacterium]|nr:MAG: hypothetical protein EPO07_13500 [Verrucomicrobiota bacterium]
MGRRFTLAIVSDIHFAGATERARGDDFEFSPIKNPFLRLPLQAYRKIVWMKHPMQQNGQFDRFLAEVPPTDFVIANGDFPCGSAWLGLSDDATFESARECVGRLRARFGEKLHMTLGDHELGKSNLLGERGGLRLQSWQRATGELNLQPFWQLELGNYVLIGVASTLVSLPVYDRDILPAEQNEWLRLRELHLAEIREAFSKLRPEQCVILFCHDPTALPFLWREDAVKSHAEQIEQTIIGHLHSPLYLWKSRLLAGMPAINFLGTNVRRMSRALNEARTWKHFHVRLCPSLAGIELLKDGGYYTAELDAEAKAPAKFQFHPLPR